MTGMGNSPVKQDGKRGGPGAGTIGWLMAAGPVGFIIGGATSEQEPQPAASGSAPVSQFADLRPVEGVSEEFAQPAVYQAPESAYEAEPIFEPEPVQSVYYTNCSAARAAGAAPVRSGDPGYAPHLDRDSDGVGCE